VEGKRGGMKRGGRKRGGRKRMHGKRENYVRTFILPAIY
jgi:hypothetical protein